MTMTDDNPAALDRNRFRGQSPRLGDAVWDRSDWQRLWIGTQRRPWRSLAVVAADGRVSTLEIANLITALGLRRGETMGVADVRDVASSAVDSVLLLAEEILAGGERLVFAARPISENVATIPVARFCDCVLLCVSMGSTSLALVEETVSQVGKERFLGSLLIDLAGRPVTSGTSRRVGAGGCP